VATVVSGVSATSTTDNTALTSASFTPNADDLLIAVGMVKGHFNQSGHVFTDSQALGFTQITFARFNGSTDSITIAVANAFAANSGMTVTLTPSSTTCTGLALSVLRVTGMAYAGLTAIRQSSFQSNQAAAGTPAPAFGVISLNDNPTIGAVGNGTNPAGMTPPASWSERHDIGFATPDGGLETCNLNKAFSGTTVTWGSASASAFAALIIELDASEPWAFLGHINAQSDRRPTWTPNKSSVVSGYDAPLIVPHPGVAMIQARGIVPPPRRTSQGVAIRNVTPIPDAPPELGWNQVTVVKPVQPIPIRRRTQSLMDLGITVPNGPDAWLTNTFRSGHKQDRPRINRSFFALPMERTPPFPDAWLTVRKPAIQPPARAGKSQSLFLTVPYENDPFVRFYHDRRTVQPRWTPNTTQTFYIRENDVPNVIGQLFHRSPIVQPKWTPNTSRAWIVEPPRIPMPGVTMIRPVQRIGKGSSHFALPDVGGTPMPGFISISGGRFPTHTVPSRTFTPILETTSTGIMQVGWMPPRVARPRVILIRGPVSQLFYAPGLVETYVRKDNRNSGGAGMGASSTGGSGRARTATGVGTQG
jgi:hypothetical protein